MTIRLSFLGGAQEVGRSAILVSTEKSKILLDAGLKPEAKKPEYPQITERDIRTLDGVFLTHAHLDHCGFTPHLFARGYKGKIYAIKPTIELLSVQVADYMRLSNPEEVTKEALERMTKSLQVVDYNKPFKIKDFTIEFIHAGHILGSALLKVTHQGRSVVYTGDINLAQTKLLEGAELKDITAETLITESTYGGMDDVFPNEKEMARAMVQSIKHTLLAGGKVIIPSFAVQRGQEVLLFLDDFMNSGVLPKVPIYVDGAIGKVLRIHRHNVIFCRKEIQSKILMSDYDPFKSENFVMVEAKSMRQKIVDGGACIIVTTAGMLTGGPVVFYLKKLAHDSLNKLILVGFQPEGTAGRALQDGAKEIDFHDERLRVNLSVEVFHMSAHADRKQLESIPKKIKGLKEIFIVHGEKSKMESLKQAFEKDHFRVVIPKLGESFTVDAQPQRQQPPLPPQPIQQQRQPSSVQQRTPQRIPQKPAQKPPQPQQQRQQPAVRPQRQQSVQQSGPQQMPQQRPQQKQPQKPSQPTVRPQQEPQKQQSARRPTQFRRKKKKMHFSSHSVL